MVVYQVVEEEEKPEIIKEKKEVKRSKSSGRRSTRAKKSISYRSEMFYLLSKRRLIVFISRVV